MSVSYIIKNKKRGFTLIEMMVSVTIFSIVTLIVSGAFIVLADIYRQIQSNRAVIDNLNLAMDTMTLQIREGKNYAVSSDQIAFDEYVIKDNEYVKSDRYLTYRLKDGSGILEQCVDEILDDDSCNDLTSSEIQIETLYFEEQQTNFPRQILVILEGVASNKKGLESRFLLQSTLSQRNL